MEKRRKLAETWDRVIKMQEKDQPEQFADLKKLWNNYQARKIEVVKYYESVISAQDVDVDAIPLPSAEGGFDGLQVIILNIEYSYLNLTLIVSRFLCLHQVLLFPRVHLAVSSRSLHQFWKHLNLSCVLEFLLMFLLRLKTITWLMMMKSLAAGREQSGLVMRRKLLLRLLLLIQRSQSWLVDQAVFRRKCWPWRDK